MTKLNYLFSVIGMLFAPISLFAFSFTVTPTPETCAGNATLTFAASSVDPAGAIEYFVYKLPDTVVSYATVISTNLSGLTGGDYLIIAKETVNNVVTSQQQQNVTITSSVQPLQFTVISLNQTCATTSTITVNVTSGIALNYEIFFGPVLFPAQTSNTFSNLPVGVYKICVFDACGIGVVSTFNVMLNPTGLSITNPTFSNTLPPSCNTTVATQTITPITGTVISYPLTIQYVIHPPADVYNLTIQDKLGCGKINQEVWILNYPNFFTPNGDGFNDFWKIKNSELEPNLKVYFYDRQGILIKYLDAEASWNGDFIGNQLIADDYWFVVIREDGRELKGNFTLKR